MRREDREMSREFALGVIDRSVYGVVSAVNAGNQLPYSVPLSIVREGEKLYFHSATEGTKVDLFKKVKQVRVVFVGDVNVPNLFTDDQLEEMVHDKNQIGRIISSVFTTEFESAIVVGELSEVTEPEVKKGALRAICLKYTPEKMKYFDIASEAGVNYTKVFEIRINSITGKRKKYDDDGVERKWGR